MNDTAIENPSVVDRLNRLEEHIFPTVKTPVKAPPLPEKFTIMQTATDGNPLAVKYGYFNGGPYDLVPRLDGSRFPTRKAAELALAEMQPQDRRRSHIEELTDDEIAPARQEQIRKFEQRQRDLDTPKAVVILVLQDGKEIGAYKNSGLFHGREFEIVPLDRAEKFSSLGVAAQVVEQINDYQSIQSSRSEKPPISFAARQIQCPVDGSDHKNESTELISPQPARDKIQNGGRGPSLLERCGFKSLEIWPQSQTVPKRGRFLP